MPKELLIADANATAQEEFEKIFEGMDAQLIFAENGEDALLKIKLYKPDLVIADVTMPNRDGFELCKIVKANRDLKQIPFVLLAGIFEEIDKSEQEKVGADGVMTKPLKGEEIVPLVDDLLRIGPTPLQTEEMVKTESAEGDVEETTLSMEGPSAIEGLEEVELSHPGEVLETQPEAGEDEEAIIELTDVVEEDASEGVSPGESVVDESLEQVIDGQVELTAHEEGLEEITIDGIDLDEPKGELELEEIALAEEALQGTEEKTEEPQTEGVEGLEFETSDEGYLDEEKGAGPSDEAMEAELEEEIDRRIDLVLGEEGDKDEEDTLLELEGGEEEPSASLDGTEELEALAEGIAHGETSDTGRAADEVLSPEEEPLVEPGESEGKEEMLGEAEPSEESTDDALREAEERETLEPSSDETSEDLEELVSRASEEFSDDLKELSLEDLESLEESVETLEELPVEDELEEFLEEGTEGFEEPGEKAGEESLEEDIGPESLSEPTVEGDSEIEEILEEVSDGEDLEVEGVDEKELADVTTESPIEATDERAGEEVEEVPLEELEEGFEEGEDFLEEPSGEPVKGSAEAFSYPTELIKEEHVSEEEIDTFQKRLTADSKSSETETGMAAGTPDDRIEFLVRRAVEQVVKNALDRKSVV